MTLEQLLILIVFVLAPLLNLLVRVLRRRLPGPAPGEPAPGAPETSAPARMPSPRPVPQRARAAPVPPLVTAPPALARPRRRRPTVRIGGAGQARRAFVLMAVFGPCRGLEPPRTAPTGRRQRQPAAAGDPAATSRP